MLPESDDKKRVMKRELANAGYYQPKRMAQPCSRSLSGHHPADPVIRDLVSDRAACFGTVCASRRCGLRHAGLGSAESAGPQPCS